MTTINKHLTFRHLKQSNLRDGKHKNICVNDFALGSNEITAEENACKTVSWRY